MIKRALLAGIIFCLLTVIWAAMVCAQPTEVKQSLNNICRVDIHYGRSISQGSGVYIQEEVEGDYVLSCWHLIRDGRSNNIRVTFPYSKETISATIEAYDRTYDQLLLKLSRKPNLAGAPVRIGKDLNIGDRVYFAGYAGGTRLVMQTATYTHRSAPQNGNMDHRTANRSAYSGMSGGPVVDEQGQVIGDLFARGMNEPACHYVGCSRTMYFLSRLFPRLSAWRRGVQERFQGLNPGGRFCPPGGCRPLPPSQPNGPGGDLQIPFPGEGSGEDPPQDSDLEDRLSEVESAIDELKNEPAPEIPDVSDIRNDIADLKNQINQLASRPPPDTSEIESVVEDMQAEIDELKNANQKLQERVAAISEGQQNLTDVSRGLLAEVNSLRAETESLRGETTPEAIAAKLPGIKVSHNGDFKGEVHLGERLNFNFIEKAQGVGPTSDAQ